MWEAIEDAYEYVKAGHATRIDGAGWSVYRAGKIIRVDVRQS